MSSVCISNSVDDARIPIRATYHNLYKWPESDAEFMKSALIVTGSNQHRRGPPRVVDSISCRQLYLRSYTFSKQDTAGRTKMCLDKVREKVVALHRKKKQGVELVGRGRRRCVVVIRRVKVLSDTAVSVVFKRLLCCSVDSGID